MGNDAGDWEESQTVGQSLELPAGMRGFLKPVLPTRGVPHSVGVGSALAPLLSTGVDPGNQQLGPSVSFVPCRGISEQRISMAAPGTNSFNLFFVCLLLFLFFFLFVVDFVIH